MINVVGNLLSNAIKYSKGAPEISIRTKNYRSGITIEVEDKGIGIPPKYVKYIFQKYYRVPTGDVHNIKGFGIGLSYVKKVVEAFGGKVEVESVLAEGSIFRIYLPVHHD
jgi:two-component system phosphate regulon sensor histidine kinase PhoR